MKILRSLIVLLVLVVLTAGVFLFTDVTGRLPMDIGIRLRTSTTTAVSIGVLEEIRDLYSFTTVEYIYRTVFPYDFMPQDLDIDAIRRKMRDARTDADQAALSPAEFEFLRAYNLAEDIGVDPDRDEAEFLIVAVVVRAGFDLAGTVFANPAAAGPEEIEAAVAVTEEEGSRRIATVRLPPAQVVDLIVEDVSAEDYPYPDIGLSPEGWRAVSAFVSEGVRARTIADGILDRARDNGRRFVEGLLIQAGFDEVRFVP